MSTCSQSVAFSTCSILTTSRTANATTLFPQLVATSRSYSKTGSFDPKEMFEVITTSSNSTFQATLVGGPLTARRPVARGASADGVAGALSGLLKVLGEALGWYADTLLGEMESAEATECGMVNFTLVEGGFHFAHVQRWAQTQMTGV